MIIPVRCMSCGKVLADKWEHFKHRVEELRKIKDADGKSVHPAKFYSDGKNVPKTAECIVLDELEMTRWCCRTALLTHVDTLDKL